MKRTALPASLALFAFAMACDPHGDHVIVPVPGIPDTLQSESPPPSNNQPPPVIDDQPADKVKSYESFSGNWRLKKVVVYDDKSRIHQVTTETGNTTNVQSYFYHSAGVCRGYPIPVLR